ncbi:hypothetical protein KPH14_011422 [Odynerus spinipes]|uniref:Aminopeptidase n=1 Tax=Odynerus spinipes TaxID=1348599 RepID=A0AAD9RV54_9HYME|nr:hypothetical protein KPH14_011422 [Odynerus spinipes]
MANHPRADIAEVTFQAYASRHQTNEEQRRCWRLRTRAALMAIVSMVIASLIIYWFVNSILVSRNLDTTGHQDPGSRDQQRFTSKKQSRYGRLPTQVVPLGYILKIIPILDEGNFTILGYTEIRLYCRVPMKHVRLHAHKLDIKNITIEEDRPDNATRIITKYVFELDDDFLDIFLLQLLNAGESYILKIKYTARLDEEPYGLFRSKYQDKSTNSTRWIAVSNFSPDFARTAFPCFDEPSIKAPFEISIGRWVNMRTHSNSMRIAVEKIHDMPGYVWDHYEKTLPMSTYLTAFMVTDFQSYQINATGWPLHSVFARKDVQNDTVCVGYLIPSIVRLMQNLTGFHYDLSKLDVIMVPSLAYSAMENWGLITFREDSILVPDKKHLIEVKQGFARIASHEVAHQWFGNLVTPKWWSDVWLKEGFSSFFGIMALSMVDSFSSMQDMLTAQYHEMFERESTETAHPLHLNLTTRNNLKGVFDSTPYVKGNCLINMIYHFLGESTFFSSIRRYISTYHYRSANEDDLWDIFQQEITSTNALPKELSMGSIMKTWTHQAGFPVVHVIRNNETGLVELTQERFYRHGLNGTTIAATTTGELWRIPLTWTIESDQRFDETLPKAWMLQRRMVINDTGLSEAIFDNQWILFNINQTGLYRVNYDVQNWSLLTSRFNFLPETTKLQLLNDAFAMFNAGLIEHDLLTTVLFNFDANTEEAVWLSAVVSLRYIKYRLWDSQDFKFAMCKLVDEVYSAKAKNMMKSDLESWTRFKIEMTKVACSMGHKTCLNILKSYVEGLLAQNGSMIDDIITREFRAWAYCTYSKLVSPEQWRKLIETYRTTLELNKPELAYALGCVLNATLIEGYLSFVSNKIGSQNSTINVSSYLGHTLVAVADNPNTFRIAMDFMERMENMNMFQAIVTDYKQLIEIFYGFSNTMDQEENVKWLTRFKDSHESKYESTVIGSIINDVKFNVVWNRRYRNSMVNAFRKIAKESAENEECSKN